MKIIAKQIKVRGYYRVYKIKTTINIRRKKGGTAKFPATKIVRKWIKPYYKLIDVKVRDSVTEGKK